MMEGCDAPVWHWRLPHPHAKPKSVTSICYRFGNTHIATRKLVNTFSHFGTPSPSLYLLLVFQCPSYHHGLWWQLLRVWSGKRCTYRTCYAGTVSCTSFYHCPDSIAHSPSRPSCDTQSPSCEEDSCCSPNKNNRNSVCQQLLHRLPQVAHRRHV